MDLNQKLLETLEEIYGSRNPNTSRFGSTSLGEIADDLCLSKSLITKLTSGTATQGMYERCLNNLDRVRIAKSLVKHNEQLESQIADKSGKKLKIIILTLLGSLLALAVIFYLNFANSYNQNGVFKDASSFLDNFFNPDFDSPSFLPYVPSDKVQEYCPCSGYEGDWVLAKPYIIPIPFKKPGLYYLAKSSDVKLKCASSAEKEIKGKKMHGFEIMKHELWMDTKHEPLVPKYFDAKKKQYTKEFYNLDFESNPRFERVSEFTSFFYNTFQITESEVIRKGEPAGRYASYVNENAVSKYKIDLNEILNHVLGNMIKVSCEDIPNPFCNPNSLIEGESTLNFNCEFSIATENLGYGGTYPYVKGFKLINQHYSNNLLCNCTEDKSD